MPPMLETEVSRRGKDLRGSYQERIKGANPRWSVMCPMLHSLTLPVTEGHDGNTSEYSRDLICKDQEAQAIACMANPLF